MTETLCEGTVDMLFRSLIEDLGPDIVGLHLMNLAKLRIQGQIGEQSDIVREALVELFHQTDIERNNTSVPGHPFR